MTLIDLYSHSAILSENKCKLLFWSLVESPGDLTMTFQGARYVCYVFFFQ